MSERFTQTNAPAFTPDFLLRHPGLVADMPEVVRSSLYHRLISDRAFGASVTEI